MEPQFYIRCYPWNLEDEGLDTALGRLAGEIGVDAITVAAALPEVTQLCTIDPMAGRSFRCKAGAHFQPEAQRYAATRIRPIPAAWMKSRNPLERIVQAAQKHRLKIRAWIEPLQGESLAERYAHAAAANVFGDDVSNRLCPANPEVREYAAALAEDVCSYPVEALELAGLEFGAEPDALAAYQTGVDLSPVESAFFADWCFCASCRQRAADAGVDVQGAAKTVSERIASAAAEQSGESETFRDVLNKSPFLAAYQRVRVETVASLVRMIRERVGVRLLCRESGRNSFCDGQDIAHVARHCDGVIFSCDDQRPAVRQEAIDAVGGAGRTEVCYQLNSPSIDDGPILVSAVFAAARKGYAGIGFAAYGLTPPRRLDWVRQAVRYARREAP